MLESLLTKPGSSSAQQHPFDPRNDLLAHIDLFEAHCLLESRIFCADLFNTACSVLGDQDQIPEIPVLYETPNNDEYLKYSLATLLIRNQEMRRASHVLRECKSHICRFLRLYSYFLWVERNLSHEYVRNEKPNNILQDKLKMIVENLDNESDTDSAFFDYIRGSAYKLMAQDQKALKYLARAINRIPLMFEAWLKIREIIAKPKDLSDLEFVQHWARDMYAIDALTRLGRTGDPSVVRSLFDSSFLFYKSAYISRLRVIWSVEIGHPAQAKAFYQMLKKHDIEIADVYSHILYIVKDCNNLALLAQQCRQTDPYRHQTSIVLGNFYSVLKKNKNAFIYFHRALQANPFYVRAWTLCGHELIELRQFISAIFCYWRAIQINPNDYRAWYGLANVFELLKMNEYCLSYYANAHILKPDDPRFLSAIADICVASGRYDTARHAYWKCYMLKESDKRVLLAKLASVLEKVGNRQDVARIHLEMVDRMDCANSERIPSAVERSALKFLKGYAETNMDQALSDYAEQKDHRFASLGKCETKLVSSSSETEDFVPIRAIRKIHHSLRKSWAQDISRIASDVPGAETNKGEEADKQ